MSHTQLSLALCYWLITAIWLGFCIIIKGVPSLRDYWIVILVSLLIGWLIAPLRVLTFVFAVIARLFLRRTDKG